LLIFATPLAAQLGGPPLPESPWPAQELIREGKLDEALAVYKKALAGSPDPLPLHGAMGNLLDLRGQRNEAAGATAHNPAAAFAHPFARKKSGA